MKYDDGHGKGREGGLKALEQIFEISGPASDRETISQRRGQYCEHVDVVGRVGGRDRMQRAGSIGWLDISFGFSWYYADFCVGPSGSGV